ncbi:MAG: hypothetical protein ABIQ74_05400 [Chitinophagales bacterium]
MPNISSTTDIQHAFFERIRQKLNSNLSLVNEIADVLEVSNDSAYRRLRGETALSLNEAFILASHFQIALEEIAPVKSDAVLFGRSTFRDQPNDFKLYLKETEEYFKRIYDCKERRGYYAAKDIPVFYFFQIEELARFKLFFWLKTIKGSQNINESAFSFEAVPDEFVKQGKAIARMYFHIPFAELWNEETITAVLSQINYFNEAGWFANRNVALKLCEKLEELFSIIQQQAQTGLMYFDGKVSHPETHYELFYNDLVALDNSIYIKTDQFNMAMVSYNSMDYLFTFHPGFCRETEQFLKNQQQKSLLLTGSSQKERNKFFNRMQARIQALKMKL